MSREDDEIILAFKYQERQLTLERTEAFCCRQDAFISFALFIREGTYSHGGCTIICGLQTEAMAFKVGWSTFAVSVNGWLTASAFRCMDSIKIGGAEH